MMREPVRPIIIMFLFAAGGIITWLATDGILFVWKEFCHPPFSMPIALIFAHWIIIYILFALLSFRYSALSCCGEACLRCTVGYLATLDVYKRQIVMIALTVSGILLFIIGLIYGVSQLEEFPAAALYEIGSGLVLGGAAALLTVLLYALVMGAIPSLTRKIRRSISCTLTHLRHFRHSLS